ncbi:MAG TPA: hypothetical protein VF932_10035, partial [Anaerolineae bacterium]
MSSEWPLYFRDNLTLGDRDHPAAICCLWMKQTRLAESIPASSYGILGNLYSRDGLNYLLRNILARPTVRAIVLCGPDLTRSGAALVNLSRRGVDEQHRVRGAALAESGTADAAEIDVEIPPGVLEEFRANVQVIDLRGVNDPAQIHAKLEELQTALPRGAWAAP